MRNGRHQEGCPCDPCWEMYLANYVRAHQAKAAPGPLNTALVRARAIVNGYLTKHQNNDRLIDDIFAAIVEARRDAGTKPRRTR